MAINFNDQFDIRAPKLADKRQGPWASLAAAKTGVPESYRRIGLTVIIGLSDGVEYWWKAGVADADLVLKAPGDVEAVKFTPQSLTEPEKLQARNNIGLISSAESVRQFVFVGDSTSDPGYVGGLGNDSWPRVFSRTYQPLAGATIVELAVAGTTAQAAAAAIATTIAPYTGNAESVVTIAFGTNDIGAGRTANQILADLQTISQGWRSKGFLTCVLGVPFATNDNAIARAVNAGIAAATWRDYWVDLYNLFYECKDYVHPSIAGATQISRAVAASLVGNCAPAPRQQKIVLPVSLAKAITSVSAANPAVVTCAGHGFSNGQLILHKDIAGSTATPPVNGPQIVTVINANSYSIPVNCTVAGTGGTANGGICQIAEYLNIAQMKTWLIHMYDNGGAGGDTQSYFATAIAGYSTSVLGLLPIALAPFSGPNPILTGAAIYVANVGKAYLYNGSTDFGYTISTKEMFTSTI